MSAIRIKFAGCYSHDFNSSGSGAITFGSPNSPELQQELAKDTLLARYNDLESVATLIQANKDEIAAVEPVEYGLYSAK
jgi:glutamate-1-semialdehyde 2,1-aminomutase